MNSFIENTMPPSLAQVGLDVRDSRSRSVVRATGTEHSTASSLPLLAASVGGAQVLQTAAPSTGFDADKLINSTLPKMPEYLMVATHVDDNPDPKKRIIIKPAMNIILVSPMHQQYDEASTMAVKMLVETQFEEENFFRWLDPKRGPQKAPVEILTLYEDTLVWPIKANAIWWAAPIPSASRYLQECFGALRYTEDGKTKSVSVLEAFHGPMHILLNSAFAGTLLAQMVNKGANNPTICLANLNGPVTDPTVSAAISMAASLNVPVTMWKDDTQSGYGGADDPLLMGLGTSQSVYRGYLPSGNPLRMYQGLGNFRWVGQGGLSNPCELIDGKYYAKGTQKPCDQGNAFDMTYKMTAGTYSYMGTVATPVQGVQQEKSGKVLLSPTLTDTLKESIWYGLANTQALQGSNMWIAPPIPRTCNTATCTPPYRGTNTISLPFSARYGKLLALGEKLLYTKVDGKDFTAAYKGAGKHIDHTKRTWCLQLAQAQWKIVIQVIKDIFAEAGGNLPGMLLVYFDPRDIPDMMFLFSFIAKGGVYDPNTKKYTTTFIEPVPIRE